MQKPVQSDRLRELLTDIQEADQHATDILLNVRGLLKRRSEIELQEFDLNEVIADALQMLSPEAVKRNVTLHVNGIQQPLVVRADRIHLQQVILNLARNGMDAMSDTAPDARRLTIETALPEGRKVEVSVSDSGMGIPKHKLGEIFDTFYTTKAQGTGLGLSIVRTIVEVYGGKIWAETGPEGVRYFALRCRWYDITAYVFSEPHLAASAQVSKWHRAEDLASATTSAAFWGTRDVPGGRRHGRP